MHRLALPMALLFACSPDGGEIPADTLGTTGPASTTDTATSTSTSTSTTSSTSSSSTFTTNFQVGPNDAIAQIGCDLLLGTQTAITAVDDQGMAGQVVVQPSETESWMVTLPTATQGFFTVEVGDWDTTQAFFAFVGNDYGVWVPDGDQQGPRMLNGACPNDGITDQRVFYDHWTPVTVRYETIGPRDAFFAVVQESP